MIALLPLKEFAAAKQRLSGLLSAAERTQLFQAMVEDVLSVLTAHNDIERVVICSRDHSAVWLARYYEIEFLDEAALHCHDLNGAVNAAAAWLHKQDCADLLVVHGDLPMLHQYDISEFLRAHCNAAEHAVTMACDRRRRGTNLLAWRPLQNFSAQYGIDSLQRHCHQAHTLGATPTVCDLPGARCDIDEPEDLALLLQNNRRDIAINTRNFLMASGVAERVAAMQSAAINGGERRVCA